VVSLEEYKPYRSGVEASDDAAMEGEFTTYDTDGSPGLSETEFKELYANVIKAKLPAGPPAEPPSLDEVLGFDPAAASAEWDGFDANTDGKVTKQEFVAAGQTEELFKAFDTSADKLTLSKEEYVEGKRAEAEFNKANTNGDGLLQ